MDKKQENAAFSPPAQKGSFFTKLKRRQRAGGRGRGRGEGGEGGRRRMRRMGTDEERVKNEE